LRDLAHFAVQFGRGGLVEAGEVGEAAGADGVEETQRADAVDLGGVLRHLEGHRDVGHGSEVVNLVRLDLRDDVEQIGGIGQIAIVQKKPYASLKGKEGGWEF
jgi:hypothetical protein